jgi:hypothetical protein
MTTVDDVMEHILAVNVNFLAIDFDQTMIDVHTGGVWSGTSNELAPHVRPIFTDLVSAALSSGNIHVAIVTFSKQPALIKSVLEKVLGPDVAAKIVVRGGDKSWKYEGSGSMEGKQPHMASAVEELLHIHKSSNVEITKATTLLIDDDKRNIRIALQDGVRAIWFCPNQPQQFYSNLISLL